MLVVAGLFVMLALWWFWLYIVCFMHVSQKLLRSEGKQNELSHAAGHRGRRATACELRPQREAPGLVGGHCMYFVLFACACEQRAVVTATHYILHMFFLFCTRFVCLQCILQKLNFDPDYDLSAKGMRANFSEETKSSTVRDHMKVLLVRFYLHPHDARTLHLSFDV